MPRLFDRLIGFGQQRRRRGEAQGASCLQGYGQLEARGLHHGQIVDVGSFEYPARLDPDLTIGVGSVAFWDNRCAVHNPINYMTASAGSCTALRWPATSRVEPKMGEKPCGR